MLDVKSLKHLTNLTLHDRITKSLLHLHKKKKPPSISAQFQVNPFPPTQRCELKPNTWSQGGPL